MTDTPDIKALRGFLKVAEVGNISHAAVALGTTQPSLSRAMGILEKTLGGALFHRTGRGVQLTELGKAVFPRAKVIVYNMDQLAADIRDAALGASGTVTVAILPGVMRDLAGELYESVRRAHAGVTLRMLEGFSGQVEEWLADGRADLGLLSRYKHSRAAGERVVRSSHLVLVNAARPGQSPKATIPFRELANLPLVLPASPNALRLAVDEEARRLHIRLQIVAEADSLEAQKAIIRRQPCHAILGLDTVQKDLERGSFQSRRIVDPQVPRLLILASSPQRPLRRATREVGKILTRLTSRVR